MGFSVAEVALEAVREALKLGASEAEAYVAYRRPLTLTLAGDGRVDIARMGEGLALGARVALGKRVAVGGGSIQSPHDVSDIVAMIVKIARVSSEDPRWVGLPERVSKSSVREPYDKTVEDPPLSDLVDAMRASIASVRELDARLSVIELSLWASVVERAVANSSMEVVVGRYTRVSASASVKAASGGVQSVCDEYTMGFSLRDVDYNSLLSRASSRALKGLKAASVDTGRYTIVLTPKVSAAIIGALIAPAISAESVQKNRSPLAGRIGESVLSDSITIEDDPTRENLYTAASFDDEGVATRSKTVFRNGVLETFLYDTYTARIEGRESTGNAVRPRVTASPRPSPISLIVQPGRQPLEDMILEQRRVIVVYETIGEWLSNPVSGYLNATIAYAELLEKGEFKGVIRGPVISGNIYQLLKDNVEGVSREIDSYYGVHAPALLVRDATLSLK